MIRIHHAIALAALIAAPSALAAPASEAESAMGTILVDADGMALYTFDKDEAGVSNCYDKCAENWPPLAVEDGAAEEGEWTIVERKDGSKMWAYDGQPLYTFVKDSAPGEVTGDGVNEVWHVAKP